MVKNCQYVSYINNIVDYKPGIWSDIILYKDWTMINALYLKNNDINDNSLDALLQLEWPRLSSLYLCNFFCEVGNNSITENGVRKIVNKEWQWLNYLHLCMRI